MKCALLLTVLILSSACKTRPVNFSQGGSQPVAAYLLEDVTFSIGAGSDFYFSGNECFIVEFNAGYHPPISWYYAPSLTPAVLSAKDFILNQSGSSTGNEGGFRKIGFMRGFTDILREHFEQEDTGIAEQFKILRESLIKESNRTNRLPTWLSQNPQIFKKEYGLQAPSQK